MIAPKRKPLLLAAAASLAVAVVFGVWALTVRTSDPLRDEYPAPPFAPVGASYPRIFSGAEEPPREDKAAYAAYQAEQELRRRYRREEGGMGAATADEREAYRLAVEGSDYVAGRELAVKALRKDPRSVPARFVLAVIEQESEGNFAAALFLVRKLRRELHARGVADPRDDLARDWYLRVLDREWNVLDDLTRDEETLRTLDLLEAVYEPLPSRRVWPLIRLNRPGEATAILDALEKSGRTKLDAINSRMAVEARLGHRGASYEAGKRSVETTRDSQVLWSNFAGACDSDFRPAEAEEAILKATRARSGTFSGSPFTYLSSRLAARGQFAEAWDALKQAQAQRRERAAYTLVMDQRTFDTATARLLHWLGRGEDAYRLARRSFDRPSRHRTSADARDIALTGRLFLLDVLESRYEELREIEAAGGAAADAAAAEREALGLERWALRRQVLKIVTPDEGYLLRLLRPQMPGSPAGGLSLIRLLPPGVAREALRRARREETHPGAVPYFDLMAAHVARQSGRHGEALALARKAREKLSPDYDRVERSALALVAADGLDRLGKGDEAMPLYHDALTNFPVAFRDLGLAIPLLIAVDRSPAAMNLSDRLLASPRFRGDPGGFPLLIQTRDGRLTFELFRLKGVRHCQGGVAAEGDPDEVAAAAARRLAERIMSPTLELSTTDVNSLDNGLYASPPKDTDRLLRLATPG